MTHSLTDLRKRLDEAVVPQSTGPLHRPLIAFGNGFIELVRNEEDAKRLDLTWHEGDPVTTEELIQTDRGLESPSIICGSDMAFIVNLEQAEKYAKDWAAAAAEAVKRGWTRRRIYIGDHNGPLYLTDDVVDFFDQGGFDENRNKRMIAKGDAQGYMNNSTLDPGPGECLASSKKMMQLVAQVRGELASSAKS